MKKSLLFAGIALFINGQSFSQVACTPDTISDPGIYPDTIANLPMAYADAAYGETIQLRVLTDTSQSGIPATIDSIKIINVIGLPAGFSYACNPSNGAFPGGSNGCMQLTGSPTTVQIGTYNLQVLITIYAKLFGVIPISEQDTVKGYKIKILGPPVSNFIASVTVICKGTSVQFTDMSTNVPTSWNWLFPGGTPSSSTLQNPLVTYNTTGNKSVTLTATSPAGTDGEIKSGYIQVKSFPASTITPSGEDTICSNGSLLMTANSGTNYSYQWMRNNIDIAGATFQTYTASQGGNYKVKVTNEFGCEKISSTKKISINPVTATVTPTGPTTFCNGGNVTLNASTCAGCTYKWKKNGSNIGGATGPSYVATQSGTYKVKVTNTDGCAKTSQGVLVTVLGCRNITELENTITIQPNPANDFLEISFELKTGMKMDFDVCDITGRKVIQSSEYYVEGEQRLIMDVSSLVPGIYFINIQSEIGNESRKLVVK